MSEKNIVSQMLFVSDVVPVSSSEAILIKENLDKFEKFGYGIEFLKENELIFRKVPQMIAKVNPKEILADILENIDGNIDRLEEKILITTSCKASVKAGQKTFNMANARNHKKMANHKNAIHLPAWSTNCEILPAQRNRRLFPKKYIN